MLLIHIFVGKTLVHIIYMKQTTRALNSGINISQITLFYNIFIKDTFEPVLYISLFYCKSLT